MHKLQGLLFVCLFSLILCQAQETSETSTQEADSTVTDALASENLVILDSLISTKKAINPLAPSKAAFYSTVLPGLGQIYNKKYWKAPIVWGALGGSVYMYALKNDTYRRFRTAFKRRQAGFTDDEFFDLNGDNELGQAPDFDAGDLENQQERFQEERDLWLVATIIIYALNIVDANVTAHLKQFNIDDDLSFDFQPYLDLNPVSNSANYGMALTIKF
ncbi:DUF5683 domain-containing protein [Maribacter antarcticus]|uniref:DUF5683 domain-containing protein n=1 Tax=Maribacter antarcticus TaxID=505250 RepID=UPI0012EC837F|nr:DUF5683 domain-containing protein [Maribacter antarcticus]